MNVERGRTNQSQEIGDAATTGHALRDDCIIRIDTPSITGTHPPRVHEMTIRLSNKGITRSECKNRKTEECVQKLITSVDWLMSSGLAVDRLLDYFLVVIYPARSRWRTFSIIRIRIESLIQLRSHWISNPQCFLFSICVNGRSSLVKSILLTLGRVYTQTFIVGSTRMLKGDKDFTCDTSMSSTTDKEGRVPQSSKISYSLESRTTISPSFYPTHSHTYKLVLFEWYCFYSLLLVSAIGAKRTTTESRKSKCLGEASIWRIEYAEAFGNDAVEQFRILISLLYNDCSNLILSKRMVIPWDRSLDMSGIASQITRKISAETLNLFYFRIE
ncbi:hypothetical protein KQX54_017088 [Cotesia glomerata]|uniref:Uncharacterized protein n=1 Tax=Cotesia glomerata TaxID=32391 RepID=A0AAV7IEH3_COTGL|nr:hypothetical protein KQX54_017088 [Cotesia glomerata]